MAKGLHGKRRYVLYNDNVNTFCNGLLVTFRDMTGPADRLRALSELAGFETLAEFARAAGIPDGTMRQHIARNSIPKDAAAAYVAKAAKTGGTVEWLLFNKGPPPRGVEGGNRPMGKSSRQRHADDVTIYQVNTGSMAGLGDEGDLMITADDAQGAYTFPAAGFREVYGADPSGVIIDEVRGDSMITTLWPGQRVMVNLYDRKPTPPGVFLVWDGMGMVLKRVELIPGSNPLTIRLSSDNPKYQTYERTEEEAKIYGRVIGLWSRL